ncbi:focadhesin-like [Asterias rubens]|uniref:focadhesin-like n=1 Tax=Asterias rubens TaxID=7604 RepID=UPI001455D8F0|nr:focadhesin-like [Asterias rubens]
MAEDLKTRLHFGDRGLNTAAASKLYSQIVSQKSKILKDDLITSNSPQIAELKLVWEQCTVESSSVCLACSDCLVSLVQHGHAELSYVVKGLLNVIPSAVNTTGVIQAVGKLILLQIRTSVTIEGVYHCPYGLRSPPHPFISILTSRPDCWPSVLHHVSHLLTDYKYSRYTVRMLHPFLAYTMLNPALPYQLATFKTLLTHTLLQHCQSSVSTSRLDSVAAELFAFVIDCLHQTKVTSLPELTEATSHLATIIQVAQGLPSTDKHTYKSLSVLSVTLCKDCLTHGHDMAASLKVLEQMVDVCGADVVDETLICSLSCLMLETPGNQLGGLLSVVRKVVCVCGEEVSVLNTCVQLFILPLLQVISVPVNVMGTNQISANQAAASKLLAVVRRLGQNGLKQRPALQKQNPSKNAWYQLMKYCSHLFRAVMEDTNAAYNWLVAVQLNVSHSDSVSSIVMLIVTSLLWGRGRRVVRAALDVLIQIANRDNRWAPSLLPLLLYRLGEEHDPTLTYDLLTAIPHTVTHKVCMTSVLKTLQSLSAGDENMYPLVMRLITQLWKIQIPGQFDPVSVAN